MAYAPQRQNKRVPSSSFSLSFSSSSFLFIRFLVSTADQLRRLMIGAFGPFNGGGGIAL